MKRVFLSIGHDETEAFIRSIEGIEIVDSESDLDTLINLLEFVKLDYLIINRLLDDNGDKLLAIAECARYRDIKVIALVKEYSSFTEKKLISALVAKDVYAYVLLDEVCEGKINQYIDNYPISFDFGILEEKKQVIINDEGDKGAAMENIDFSLPIHKSNEVKTVRTTIIGVAGSEENVGCTHTAIALASFLGRQKQRAAYVELNENPIMYDYCRTLEAYKEIDGGYRINQYFDVYVKYLNSKVEYGKAIAQKYNYLVLDLGVIGKVNSKGKIEKLQQYIEMERVELPILVGGGSRWQLTILKDVATTGYRHWKIYVNFADPEKESYIKTAFKEQVGMDVFLSPYCPDPFKVYQTQDDVFSKMLSEYLPLKSGRNSPITTIKKIMKKVNAK